MPIRLKLRSVEPFVPLSNAVTANLLWLNGQNDAALAMFKAIPTIRSTRLEGIARVYATAGRYGEAADTLLGISSGSVTPAHIVQAAARILRLAPAAVPLAGNFPSLDRMGWVYLYVGAPEQSLQLQERMVDLGFLSFNEAYEFWHPDYAPVRKTERFKALMRKVGLVELWRAKGWPEFCHPTTGDDFACE
jgi:hypothetical protein